MGERESDERSSSRPAELTALLSAAETAGRETAWARFLAKYSRPILHTVYSRCSGYDSAMDRYAYILEKLQDEDFRRLRGYVADGRAEFSTWLAVVTRRLCEDFRRQRYGRPQSHTTEVAGVASGLSGSVEGFIAPTYVTCCRIASGIAATFPCPTRFSGWGD